MLSRRHTLSVTFKTANSRTASVSCNKKYDAGGKNLWQTPGKNSAQSIAAPLDGGCIWKYAVRKKTREGRNDKGWRKNLVGGPVLYRGTGIDQMDCVYRRGGRAEFCNRTGRVSLPCLGRRFLPEGQIHAITRAPARSRIESSMGG